MSSEILKLGGAATVVLKKEPALARLLTSTADVHLKRRSPSATQP